MTTEKVQKKLPGKQLFVTLMGLTCLLIAGIILLFWWAEKTGLAGIHPSLPRIAGLTLAAIAGAVVLATVLLVLTTILGKDIMFTRLLRGTVIKLLLPAIEFIGKGKDTAVTLTQTGLANVEARNAHEKGWNRCFDGIEHVLRAK